MPRFTLHSGREDGEHRFDIFGCAATDADDWPTAPASLASC
jgi:hypothetical protein